MLCSRYDKIFLILSALETNKPLAYLRNIINYGNKHQNITNEPLHCVEKYKQLTIGDISFYIVLPS